MRCPSHDLRDHLSDEGADCNAVVDAQPHFNAGRVPIAGILGAEDRALMRRAGLGLLVTLGVAVPTSPAVAQVAAVREAIARRLATRIAQRDSTWAVLDDVYRSREYLPLWSDDRGPLPIAGEVLSLVADAAREGLEPARYPLDHARTLLENARSIDDLAELEIVLSEAWLSYAHDVSLGRVEPAAIDSLWRHGAPLTLTETLRAALARDDVVEALRDLAPPFEGYRRLRLALEHYRTLAAGPWDALPEGPSLTPGATGPRVTAVRERLIALGDLSHAASGPVYDSSLMAAVRRFQERHGLAADGLVEGATLAALNVAPAARVRQLEANLERWRWLPRALGARRIVLNIPAFSIELVEDDRVVLALRAVVGRTDWPTPIVSGVVTHVVLNPSWRVPHDIAVSELLPLVRADPHHLAREGIEVLSATGRPVDPDAVDWTTMTDTAFRLRFVQAPGPRNPLGLVKLEFANPFAVFVHGTPQPEQFRQAQRALSHGCVRTEQAVELAVYLLRDDPAWSRDTIRAALERGQQLRIPVRKPPAVHLAYWTAWVNAAGAVQFRDDVYGWDAKLLEALQWWSSRNVGMLHTLFRMPSYGQVETGH